MKRGFIVPVHAFGQQEEKFIGGLNQRRIRGFKEDATETYVNSTSTDSRSGTYPPQNYPRLPFWFWHRIFYKHLPESPFPWSFVYSETVQDIVTDLSRTRKNNYRLPDLLVTESVST